MKPGDCCIHFVLANSEATMVNLPPLSTETVLAIVQDELGDDQAHHLVWHCLGYRWDEASQSWDASGTEGDWAEVYPEPPAFVESRPATVKLTRSIPKEDKQLLKERLNFQGYKVGELVPRLTRRATMANWLLSYMNQRGMLA
jgi:hypothetical protein